MKIQPCPAENLENLTLMVNEVGDNFRKILFHKSYELGMIAVECDRIFTPKEAIRLIPLSQGSQYVV
jgi:hypothetical protein